MIEIRWHGRGGQGTKSAVLWFADIVFKKGKYVQGFPEYAPERTGAPLTAYNRLSDRKIKIHSDIYNPDYIVIVDETQIDNSVIKGIKEKLKERFIDREELIIGNLNAVKETWEYLEQNYN